MNRFPLNHLNKSLVAFLVLGWTTLALPADNLLFIGNSFTYGGNEKVVSDHGGIPELVQEIAIAKGKPTAATMLTTGGKDWGFHLANPPTETFLHEKTWDFVVLQDYSTKPTHVGNVEEFMKNGATFYNRIAAASPKAKIVLYETWAYDAKHPIFGKSSPTKFASPEEMMGELHKNYTALQTALQSKDASREILYAPVGTAFARCVKEHPEINLYMSDLKHPSKEGCYLSALVLYATIFHDSPVSTTNTFASFTLDAQVAQKLQIVAQEVTQSK